jgi:SAM-dependent methyltransferase
MTGLVALTARVAARHQGSSRFARNFVRGKMLTDPATREVLRIASAVGGFGQLADLGCGRGQAGLALLLSGLAEHVEGIDLDPVKVRDAARATIGLPARYTVGDLGVAEIPACDTALVLDVLILLPEPAQARLLERLAVAVRHRVLIRAFDPDRGLRARLGMTLERVGLAVRRDGPALRPMPLSRLAAPFAAAGFAVSVRPCWGWTPLPNVMLLAERRAP